MNKLSNISFIIPAYNCADTISETIESILNGNFHNGDEIVIVDDFSTDDTVDIICSYVNKNPSIKMFRHQVNKGTAAAGRNTGIEQAQNELIFCLDSDNILIPNSVDNLKKHLLIKQADAAAFGELWFFSENTNIITHKWVFQDVISFADALAGYYWPGPSGNYLFTRSGWQKAGRYFEPYLENQTLDSWTFGIRQLGTGQKMVTLPETGYLHRYGHESHYIRNSTKGNKSLSALIGILPFMDQIEDADVDYIFSKIGGLLTWYDKLEERPIRLKNHSDGINGHKVIPNSRDDQNYTGTLMGFKSIIKHFLRMLTRK